MGRRHTTRLNEGSATAALKLNDCNSSILPIREVNLPIVGLANEQRRVRESLSKRESLLLLGPRGSGKTTTIRAAINILSTKTDIVYVHYSPTLHELLASMMRALLQCGHGHLHRLLPKIPDREKWLLQQTSLHLKGLLWNALETEPRTLVLDEIHGASHPIYRFLQRLYFAKGVTMYAVAQDSSALGALGRLFWHPEKVLHFKPLSAIEAAQLFDLAVDHFNLHDLGIEEFRPKVLDAANGNPGQIIEMCRLATDPRYISGRYIKFAPLRIDTMVKFLA